MEKIYAVTVLTPTFNRLYTLPRLYDSLCKQTNKNFQWLVIDDGSTDKTKEWFENLEAQDFCIEYHKKENGGKHTALNYSHSFIKGEYLVIVDSDDYLINDAIDTIIKEWSIYGKDELIGGITFQRKNQEGMILDTSIRKKGIKTIYQAINEGMHGDHCETVRTSLFKTYKFPVFEKEKYIAEMVMWVSIAKETKIVYENKAIYCCEYLQGGLTQAGRNLRIHNPRGGMYHAKFFMSNKFRLKIRIKNGLLYTAYGFFAGEKGFYIYKKNKNIIIAICIIPGWILYKCWRHYL